MSRDDTYRLRLYVAGEAQNSVEALANLTAICKAALPERHSIEIIDVFKDPSRALADRVFMTPSLVKVSPAPMRTIVGTLSDADKVLSALGLSAVAA